jgi:hypothetical protein
VSSVSSADSAAETLASTAASDEEGEVDAEMEKVFGNLLLWNMRLSSVPCLPKLGDVQPGIVEITGKWPNELGKMVPMFWIEPKSGTCACYLSYFLTISFYREESPYVG